MSRSRIKGITIEIGGDATGLDKALSGVNSQIKTTQTQLRDVDRLLKLDPSNITLLQQKKRLLGDEIKNTREKLGQLREASKRANAQLANGEISQAQFEALQREIIATEQQLKQLENTAGSASARLAQISEKTGRFGERAQAAGRAIMPLSVAAMGFGTAAVMAGASLEASLSNVRASTGATEAEMDKLTATAREWGRTSIYSATQVADAMGYMGLAGWDTTQIYDGLEGILHLAASAKLDLGQATQMVTKGLTAFGLEASDAGRFADVLATANKNANTSVTELGQGFKYVGPIAGALGYSIEDTALAMGLMADAGVVGSQAGTALRAALSDLTNPSEQAAALMEELGIKMFDTNGQAKPLEKVLIDLRAGLSDMTQEQQNAAMATLFSQTAISGMTAVVNASESDFKNFSNELQNASGNAEKFAGIMNDNLHGQLKILKNTIKDVGIGIAQALLPIIKSLVDRIQVLVTWFSNMSPRMQSVIAMILGIVAAAGPLLIIIGKMAMAISAITGALSKLATIKKILIPLKMALAVAKGVATAAIKAKTIAMIIKNAVMKANPIVAIIMLIIGAITLLVAGIKWLWNNNESFREGVIAIWEGIKNFFSTIIGVIVNIFKVKFEVIRTVVETVVNTVKNIIKTVFGIIRTKFETIVGAIVTFVEFKFRLMKTVITTVINAIRTVIDTVLNFIRNIFNTILSFIVNLVRTKFEAMRSVITAVTSAIRNVIDTVFNAIRNVVSSVLDAIRNIWSSGWSAMKNIVGTLLGGAVNIITGIIDRIRGLFTGLASQAVGWGRHMIQGFVDGIMAMVGRVVDAVSGVARTVRDFLGFTRPDKGPLHVYEEWMPHMMQGLAKGIRDNIHLITKELNAVSEKMKMGVNSNFDLSAVMGPQTIYLTNTQVTNLDGKPIAETITPVVIKRMTAIQNNQKAGRGR